MVAFVVVVILALEYTVTALFVGGASDILLQRNRTSSKDIEAGVVEPPIKVGEWHGSGNV